MICAIIIVGGTAECAIPKLLHYAAENGLVPVAACEGVPSECLSHGSKLDRTLHAGSSVATTDSIALQDACEGQHLRH